MGQALGYGVAPCEQLDIGAAIKGRWIVAEERIAPPPKCVEVAAHREVGLFEIVQAKPMIWCSERLNGSSDWAI
jgi:hypothetical protein